MKPAKLTALETKLLHALQKLTSEAEIENVFRMRILIQVEKERREKLLAMPKVKEKK